MSTRDARKPLSAAARTPYLPALDGLRAVSVLGVLAFHAELPGVRGGFLGVEVFFVISGYLITSLLLLEQRAGTLSLRHFWLRRARRLLPALYTVLIAALGLALWLGADAFAQARSDCLAALFYVSNWWQIARQQSYFMAVDRPPLLLHLWSLAVEEQFYVFWPLVIAGLGQSRARWLAPVALVGALASAARLAWLFDPSVDATRVYFGTDTRLSGLLWGAALAALSSVPLQAGPETRAARTTREALGVGGACALLFLLASVGSHDPFVYRGGLLFVDLASCALIAGVTGSTVVAALLGAAPLSWLGRRSYGLYLWHWPIFAVTRPELDVTLTGLPLLALRLGSTFVAAELCYRFVEEPLRSRSRETRRGRSSEGLTAFTATSAAAVLVIALVCVAGPQLAMRARATEVRADETHHAGSTRSVVGPPRADVGAAAEVPVTQFGIPLDSAWPKTLTVLSDSVTLSLTRSLPAALPGWKVEILGRPALMVKQAVPEFLNARAVASVVVIGLGYNSLFEKERKNYPRWSALWDHAADKLILDLKACGAKKVIWVTLREPPPELVTDAARDQYQQYAWFFPYVNERIRALAQRDPELGIADWRAVSNVPDITTDFIHLNPTGVTLMTNTIARAVLGFPPEAG